ncbi:MAG: ribonuclease P protein component [Acidimicrobiia bacterium]|nr:ribonuclease P protein component [Acidimicrobiia bacterium]
MIVSIRRRRTFAELRQRGLRVKHGAVRLTYLDQAVADLTDTPGSAGTSGQSTPQVAFALGRKFGTAVERNRARRRLRDAFATSWARHQDDVEPALQLHGAFLLSGHRGLLSAPFDQLVADVTGCFAQLMVTTRNGRRNTHGTPRSPEAGR